MWLKLHNAALFEIRTPEDLFRIDECGAASLISQESGECVE